MAWSEAAREAALAARRANSGYREQLKAKNPGLPTSSERLKAAQYLAGPEHRASVAANLRSLRTTGTVPGANVERSARVSNAQSLGKNFGSQAASSTYYRNALKASVAHTDSFHGDKGKGV